MPRIGFLAACLLLALMAAALIAPNTAIAEDDGIFAEIHTAKGVITARLFYRRVPLTVMNFVQLAEGTRPWTNPKGGAKMAVPLYQNLVFHRVRDFMVQTGDPTGTGYGGPGHTIRCELTDADYVRGTVGMALAGPDTGGSQFFVTYSAQPHLDNRYIIFGRVTKGQEVVDRLQPWDQILKIH